MMFNIHLSRLTDAIRTSPIKTLMISRNINSTYAHRRQPKPAKRFFAYANRRSGAAALKLIRSYILHSTAPRGCKTLYSRARKCMPRWSSRAQACRRSTRTAFSRRESESEWAKRRLIREGWSAFSPHGRARVYSFQLPRPFDRACNRPLTRTKPASR